MLFYQLLQRLENLVNTQILLGVVYMAQYILMSYKISFCTQIVLKRQKNIPQTQYFQGLRDFFNSLHLHCSWWLTCQIVHYAVDTLYLIDDTTHHSLQYLKWYL